MSLKSPVTTVKTNLRSAASVAAAWLIEAASERLSKFSCWQPTPVGQL